MDRMACVDLPEFPLQLLLRQHPEWREHATVVVDADTPQGKILWVNEKARACRILPGLRYAAGLSLAGALRAAVVPAEEIDRAIVKLSRSLRSFTPHVESADASDPGVFWLDATGLERLHESLVDWAGGIRRELQRAGFRATVVVGFGRFGTYALSKAKRGVIVLDSLANEQAAARRVPLDRLAIDTAVRQTLGKLGVRTVGQLIDLPAEGLARRFGRKIYHLHRFAAGERQLPVQPERPKVPALQRQDLERPETKISRLLAIIEQLMPAVLKTLSDRGEVLSAIHLGFRFERMGDHIERLRPAEPTLDARQLLELIRLRLEAVRRLPDGVIEVVLAADGTTANSEQGQMFASRPRRDLAAANRALARVRAELGEDKIKRARLRAGHLPEGCFVWETVHELTPPRPRPSAENGGLVRRIFAPSVPLPSRPRHEPDGWMLRGLEQGPVLRVHGPYVVSGGWWRRPVHRDYHFAETQKGELLWIYYDRVRRRWFLQGRVE